jgi:uncharacterized protein (TIGR03643 family)
MPQALNPFAPATQQPNARQSMAQAVATLPAGDVSRIIEMAWEDRTAFEAIERAYGLNESAVVALMRRTLKPSSFRMWRKRMAGRTTKHAALRQAHVGYAHAMDANEASPVSDTNLLFDDADAVRREGLL